MPHIEKRHTCFIYVGLFYFSQYTWADAFQTFDWEKALPVPDLAVKQIEQLLALV
jgi:hypothetical protein